MSYNLYLSKYSLENEIPIDDSSKNINSTYVPDDLFTWLEENKHIKEINIKEIEGGIADLQVISINNEEERLDDVISHVEENIINLINETHSQTSDGLRVRKEIRSKFKNLSRWLKIHEILMEKTEKYNESPEFLLVLG